MELALVFLVGLIAADVVRLLASHSESASREARRDGLFLRPMPRSRFVG